MAHDARQRCCRGLGVLQAVPVLTSGLVPPARFAGNMERQQTDNLLKSHSSGTYLIRERPAEAERFAISIKYVVACGAGRPLPQCHSEPRAHVPHGWGWPWTSLP